MAPTSLTTQYFNYKKELLYYQQMIKRISKFTENLINKYETNEDKKKDLFIELLKTISFGYENENILELEEE